MLHWISVTARAHQQPDHLLLRGQSMFFFCFCFPKHMKHTCHYSWAAVTVIWLGWQLGLIFFTIWNRKCSQTPSKTENRHHLWSYRWTGWRPERRPFPPYMSMCIWELNHDPKNQNRTRIESWDIRRFTSLLISYHNFTINNFLWSLSNHND